MNQNPPDEEQLTPYPEVFHGAIIQQVVRTTVKSIQKDLRNLRACRLCSLVKSEEEFEQDGCDNCERALHMKGDSEKVEECTSANFDGLIAAMNLEDSWVCKWQKIQRKAKGIYAISVSGSLKSHIVADLKRMGIRYKANMRKTAQKS